MQLSSDAPVAGTIFTAAEHDAILYRPSRIFLLYLFGRQHEQV